MSRWPLLALAVYAPHLLEEHLTGMADEPFMAAAFAPLAGLSARASSYLVFQLTFVLGLAMTGLYALGGRAQTLVLGGLALGLLAEGHHLVRALLTLSPNPGLWTAAPMPIVGALMAAALLRDKPGAKLTLEPAGAR